MKPAETGHVKKTLTVSHYFNIGFGAIVGTGWILMVGDWVIVGGGPLAAMLAFLLGALTLLPIAAVFGELTSAIPISGGIVEYIERAFGSKASFVAGWLLAFGDGVLCPWESLAVATIITQLVAEIFPVLRAYKLYTIMGSDVYLYPVLIALLFSGYVIWQNFRGSLQMARLQTFLTRTLLFGMCVAMAVSFFKGSPQNFLPWFEVVTGPASATNGTNFWTGLAAVLVLTPFFYTGLDTIPDQAEEAHEDLDWHQFGRVISWALLASCVFYLVCIYAFSTILPWTEFVKMPIPALSSLQSIHFYLYVVMLTIATIGPLGPMNSLFSATARIMLAMGRKGQLPAVFAHVDPKSGTPKAANILLAILTVIGPFLGYSMLLPLTEVAALAFIVPCTMVTMACYRLRDLEPDLPRPYKVPGGKVGIGAGVLAGGAVIALLVVPGSPAALTWVEWLILCGWLCFGAVLYMFRGKRVQKAQN
ncbi:MAG: APC family permease [Negativicoccus succinicivorans]|nr:APC family permease [Negativicoccus succinicivorans]